MKWERDDTLVHYGVQGMRWGIRRYQNKDGTVTPSGKKHYGKDAKDSDAKLRSLIKDEEDYDGYGNLMRKIEEKSGNWHEGEGVSDEFKKAIADVDREKESIDKKYDTGAAFRKEDDYLDKVADTHLPKKTRLSVKDFDEAYGKARAELRSDETYKQLQADYRKVSILHEKAMGRFMKRYQERVASIVLRDLNYEDTAAGRKFLLEKGVIFWD